MVGGKWKGRKLSKFPRKSFPFDLRPTMDRARETIFNILEHGVLFDVKGSRVLDLFCGTGALGFESLSRGAQLAYFIDNKKSSLGIVSENKNLLQVTNEVRLLQIDATRLNQNSGRDFNLIFLDPPYGKGLGELALELALKRGWVSNDAMVVWEENCKVFPPPKLRLTRTRSVGDTFLHFLKRCE